MARLTNFGMILLTTDACVVFFQGLTYKAFERKKKPF